MNTEEFRKYAKCVIDYICDYRDNISTRDVAPTLDPGYLKELVPDKAPIKGEEFKKILEDIEAKIMPGVVHWNHPQFFAYFPSGNSYPSVIGDLITSAIGSVGFSWASNPAGTELETIVLDWYAKALDLPNMFLSDHPGSRGGGALQGSASECALVCMIAARARAIKNIKGADCEQHDSLFLSQLVAYASKEAHSSIEKAAKMAMVKLRILDTDHRGRLRVDALRETIRNDSNSGLTPFFVVATVGTTGACAFDKLSEIGKICREFQSVWFHVDGAYAGNAFILPEMRQFAKGLEYADSFNTNPNKLLLTNFDASALWVKDVMLLKTALTVDPLYLQHEHSKAIDYRHYGIPLSRRFRALKLWLVFRSYGIIGLQSYIRNHISLAKKFEALVKEDARFEIRNDVYLGLVCFRLRSSDEINQELLALINHSGKMHMIPAMVRDKYVIRFCITYEHATEEHILDAWKQIQYFAEEVLKDAEIKPDAKKPPKKLTRTLSNRFAFTRSVSLEVYERQNSHLTDGCTPIVVLDQDDIIASLNRATRLNLESRNIDTDSAEELSN